LKKTNKFIYLISPIKILSNDFYINLEKIFKTKKVSFFQLRLKKTTNYNIIKIAKKIKKLTKKYNVKFIINDDPNLSIKVNADGCHIGQKDFNLKKARKILKNKILGITCHNSLKLAKTAVKNKTDYLAFGSFYESKTKKAKYKANVKIICSIKKITSIPIVAIGGINSNNYKKLLLNKANFLAISGYIWNNKKYKPLEAIKRFK
tara:strand:- start:284 stop:898 length:615 start_codon:yes stop_codon:yes gene_type:complete